MQPLEWGEEQYAESEVWISTTCGEAFLSCDGTFVYVAIRPSLGNYYKFPSRSMALFFFRSCKSCTNIDDLSGFVQKYKDNLVEKHPVD